MASVTAVELGADTCALARTAVRRGQVHVTAAETLDPAAFPGIDAFTQAVKQTRRSLRLPRRCRAVVWGLPDGASRKDPTVAPLLAPLSGAGFRIERVVSPCNALAALARLRLPRGDGATCWLGINRTGVAIVVVRPGKQLYAHSFVWDSNVGASGSQARLLQRYSLVAFLAPEIRRAMSSARDKGTVVDAIVTCGNLPEIRSLTMPLIEELDVEVEALDSLEGLVVSPGAADRLSDLAPAIRLACAGALARGTRTWDGSRRRPSRGVGPLFARAALVAVGVAALGWVVYARYLSSGTPPTAAAARETSLRKSSAPLMPAAAKTQTPSAQTRPAQTTLPPATTPPATTPPAATSPATTSPATRAPATTPPPTTPPATTPKTPATAPGPAPAVTQPRSTPAPGPGAAGNKPVPPAGGAGTTTSTPRTGPASAPAMSPRTVVQERPAAPPPAAKVAVPVVTPQSAATSSSRGAPAPPPGRSAPPAPEAPGMQPHAANAAQRSPAPSTSTTTPLSDAARRAAANVPPRSPRAPAVDRASPAAPQAAPVSRPALDASGVAADKPDAGTGARGRSTSMPPLLKDPIPRVTAILVASDRKLATVDEGRIVTVGDSIGRRIVVAIDDRAVVLREPSGVQIRVALGGRVVGIQRLER